MTKFFIFFSNKFGSHCDTNKFGHCKCTNDFGYCKQPNKFRQYGGINKFGSYSDTKYIHYKIFSNINEYLTNIRYYSNKRYLLRM